VGRSAGRHKTAARVMQAMSQISMNLQTIEFFHSDRGKGFDNHLIDKRLTAFGIKRSLSRKGCLYDNAIAESTFKAVKPEFMPNTIFDHWRNLNWNLITMWIGLIITGFIQY
jgi:putative transposase